MSIRLRRLMNGLDLGESVQMTWCARAKAPFELVFVEINSGWLSAPITRSRRGTKAERLTAHMLSSINAFLRPHE